MKKVKLSMLVMLVVLASCSKDTLEKPDGKIQFIYEDKFYSEDYYVENDLNTVIFDEKIDKLYQEIISLPDLAVLICGDTIKYYDNYNEMRETLGLNSVKNRLPDVKTWEIEYFMDKGIVGQRKGNSNYKENVVIRIFNYTYFKMSLDSPNSQEICAFTFYVNEDAGVSGGKSISWILTGIKDSQHIISLGILCRRILGRNWGEKISSFKVEF